MLLFVVGCRYTEKSLNLQTDRPTDPTLHLDVDGVDNQPQKQTKPMLSSITTN